LFERVSTKNGLMRILKTFGAAPMFFYVAHLYALLVIYWALISLFGANQGDLFGVTEFYWVWVMSAALSVAMYFPTRSFAAYKRQSTRAWVRYF